jgi:DNA-binding NarL/FixJ family response regulator
MFVRIVIVLDQRLFREGLRAVLHGRGEVQVVADLADLRMVEALIAETEPDVLVVDLSDVAEVPRAGPKPQLVALGDDGDQPRIARALQIGISALASKSDSADEVIAAIRAAAAGQIYVTPRLSQGVPEGQRISADPLLPLTGREREIFGLVVRGLSTASIACHLAISPRTVETHRAHLSRKLGAHSPADLVRYAAGRGLLPS